jgi:mono/diheme cytochrome c family protein
MKRLVLGAALGASVAVALVAAGCASLATPEAPATSSPAPSGSAAPAQVSQQVKDGAQLYVDYGCIRCHAPNGVGGVPNRLNVGGDSTIPALNNQFRSADEQFRAAPQITQILTEGSIVSRKKGVINMPSWNGVINSAQADALAAYILAGFPTTSVTYDADPATPEDIYSAYACIDCHGQVGGTSSPSPAPNPKTEDGTVPALRNPDDDVPLAELHSVLLEGSIPKPGTKGVIFMPAWGQILSTDQLDAVLPYIQDGPKATTLPAPPAATPLPLAGGASAGSSPAPSSSASP